MPARQTIDEGTEPHPLNHAAETDALAVQNA
jgi:hypothetical protein